MAHLSESGSQGINEDLSIALVSKFQNMTEQSQDFELERHADHFFQPHTQEGVYRYIYGKVVQKRMELEATLGVKYN